MLQYSKIKTKGVYSEKGSALNSVLSKNPECLICSDAVQAFLARGVSIDKTISECKDVRRFVTVRTVKGGAEKDGRYLGKAIRWYYAKGEFGTINYVISGNKVPKSDGAKPLMHLPNEVPLDIDLERYVSDAIEILHEIGYYDKPKLRTLFDEVELDDYEETDLDEMDDETD